MDSAKLVLDANKATSRALASCSSLGAQDIQAHDPRKHGWAAAVMYSLIATCKEHNADPRTHLRDVLLRIGKVSDVSELTPYGWKAKWAPVVEAHRASIVERIMRNVDA